MDIKNTFNFLEDFQNGNTITRVFIGLFLFCLLCFVLGFFNQSFLAIGFLIFLLSLILLKIRKVKLKKYAITGIIFLFIGAIVTPENKGKLQEYIDKKDYYNAYYYLNKMSESEKKKFSTAELDKVKDEYKKIQDSYKQKYLSDLEKIEKLYNEKKVIEAFELAKPIHEKEKQFDEFPTLYSKIEKAYLKEKYKDDIKELEKLAKMGKEEEFLSIYARITKEIQDKTQFDLLKEQLYYTVLKKDFQLIESYARAGKEEEFLTTEKKISEKIPNSERIKKLKENLYNKIFAKEIREVGNQVKRLKGNKSDYENSQKTLQKILEKQSSNKEAVSLKEKVDKIITYFSMSDSDLTEQLEKINFGCYDYNHPFTLTACYVTLKNPVPRTVKNIKVKWEHVATTDAVLDTTSETFYEYISPLQTKKLTKKGIFYSGGEQAKFVRVKVISGDWNK